MTENEVLELYRARGGVSFFDYDGDPKAPHAELTSCLCSDGYINSSVVLCEPEVVRMLAFQLSVRLWQAGIPPVDWVVGSAYAAVTLSYELARQLEANHGFTEKDLGDPKKMTWSRVEIPGGSRVLQCEELITTLGTTTEVGYS